MFFCITLTVNVVKNLQFLCLCQRHQGAYIKYVGGVGVQGFHKFFKKDFVAQETIDGNFSWPSNFFKKYFIKPPTNFSFLFKVYLQQYFRNLLTVMFKFQFTNIHISIQKKKNKITTKFSKKPLIFFVISKFFYNNKIKIISRKFIISCLIIDQLD